MATPGGSVVRPAFWKEWGRICQKMFLFSISVPHDQVIETFKM